MTESTNANGTATQAISLSTHKLVNIFGCHRRSIRIQRMLFGLLTGWLLIAMQTAMALHGYHAYNPVLIQECYRTAQNNSVFPSNACCKVYDYSKRDALHCIEKLHEKMLNKSYSPFEDEINKKYQEQVSGNDISEQNPHGILKWIIIGDSRVRQVFSALISRLSGPRLKYKKPSTLGKWRSSHELIEILRIGKLHEDIEVHHIDIPIQLKFYWDPKLQRLPTLIRDWTARNEKPFLLLLGSGLHWMRGSLHSYQTSGLNIASNKFKQHMEYLHPKLEDLASSTYTAVLLQDPIQESKIFPKYKGIYSNANINLYNSITKSTFSNSNVKLWDSTIPLAKHYFAQCQKTHQQSFDKLWDCGHPFHPGYIVVEKYANMLLNSICNEFIIFDDETYC